ncbi:MAG TPA: butyrate kinase [Methylomusa anaerophila]|uniref:Probable butyrate kinase n=1 Tax=Methylomusa anaerophila TaxID=1930071 RepID=A0A348AHK3_9FIRM|nr:butyrate kinase [Methylomusa anaerophila]BBB90551.1 butyrate kinase 2 [Methylomusa anaerophila]HML88843.1 butyrate kinase [Methylomusa anaerophila]
MPYKILAINPGSTSTKIGLYHGTTEIFARNINHSAEDIAKIPDITDQLEYRLEKINAFMAAQDVKATDLAAVVGRGGLLKPMASGTYRVNTAMLNDLKNRRYGVHASNLGAILADLIARQGSCLSYIVDPVVVDELAPVARWTGRPELERKSIFHALNQKAVAKKYAKSLNRSYGELNLIVAHLGGGISVGCHSHGRVIDVNNALDGEGPFSPERAGTLPAGQFAAMVLDNKLDHNDIAKLLAGKGGLVAHLGTNDTREVERRIREGDKMAADVYDAMIYGIAKSIAAAAVPVWGKVDGIILTGGIAHARILTEKLKEYVGFLAPVIVLAGENELQALAEGAYRVLTGQETAKEYYGEAVKALSLV